MATVARRPRTYKSKPIDYGKIEEDGYDIIKKLKSQGSFIGNKKRAATIKLYKWENFGEKHRFGYVLACIFSFGIVAAIKKHKMKKFKRRQNYYDKKLSSNQELRAMSADYLDRRRQGLTSRKEDKWFQKILKTYGDAALENAAPVMDVDSIKEGIAVNGVDMMKKDDVEDWYVANDAIEAEGGVIIDSTTGLMLGQKKSEHQKNAMLNAKTKKPMYEYEHMYIDTENPNADGTYSEYADINFDRPISRTVDGASTVFNCVRVKLDSMGRIDLRDPANKGVLKDKDILVEVIKHHPEAVFTLPRESFNDVDNKIGINATSGEVTIASGASAETRRIIDAFKAGLDVREGKNLVPGVDGKIMDKPDYVTEMKKLFKSYLKSEVVAARSIDWGADVTI